MDLARTVLRALGRDNTRTEPIAPEGPAGVDALGHRGYIGGLWDEIGTAQFDFLVREGLRPSHVLVDIGCGSLRGGVHFIPYLDRGNYLGVEKERTLIDVALREELPPDVYEAKQPEFVITGDFEFDKLSKSPDFALAQSLFTHLTPPLIRLCLQRLGERVTGSCVLYATFLEVAKRVANPETPNTHLPFRYTRRQMETFGRRTGWRAQYIGDWGHPRGQMMMRFSRG